MTGGDYAYVFPGNPWQGSIRVLPCLEFINEILTVMMPQIPDNVIKLKNANIN